MLNPNALNFVPKSDQVQYDFFKTLFQSKDDDLIDYVVHKIPIKTLSGIEKVYNDLFEVFKELGNLSIQINIKNIIKTINSLDAFFPEIIIENEKDKKPEDILSKYMEIRRSSLKNFLNYFTLQYNEIKNQSDEDCISYYSNQISKLTFWTVNLSKIRHSSEFVHIMMEFFWNSFKKFHDTLEIRMLNLEALVLLTDYIKNLLLLSVDDCTVTEAQRNAAVNFFEEIKNEVINCSFKIPELIYVVEILDKRNRFIGEKVDAIPENVLHNNYIICSKYNTSLQNDEFYADLDSFIQEVNHKN